MINVKRSNRVLLLLGLILFCHPISEIKALEIGDLVFCQGFTGWFPDENVDLKVGHAGIYTGHYGGEDAQMVVEAMPDAGVSKVTFSIFVTRQPYFGNRTTSPAPNADQRRRVCLYAVNRIGLPYVTSGFKLPGLVR